MPTSSSSFLRQLSSGNDLSKSSSSSKRWLGVGIGGSSKRFTNTDTLPCRCEQEQGLTSSSSSMTSRKRVMVVVDHTSRSRHAMVWALTHVANKGDLLTLLHVIPPGAGPEADCSPYLANSLGSLCKASRPEVEVEALVIQGPILATVTSQVKKLEVSVLVLGQKKPAPLISCFCWARGYDELVDQCIKSADCLTIGVRKQSKGMGGYLISTRWQKNFWLLA